MDFDDWARSRRAALLRFAMVLSCDHGVAEDTVQEVLVKAHRHWERISALDVPDQYVRRMVVNEYLSWRRKWWRFVPSAVLRIDDVEPGHEDRQAERAALAEELAKLPAKQRAVIAMRYYADMSDADIAETLSCRQSTVRSQAFRALARLRVELTPATPVGDLRAEEGARHAN